MIEIVKRLIVAFAVGVLFGSILGAVNKEAHFYDFDESRNKRTEITESEYEKCGKCDKEMRFNNSLAYYSGAIAFSGALLLLFVPGMLKSDERGASGNGQRFMRSALVKVSQFSKPLMSFLSGGRHRRVLLALAFAVIVGLILGFAFRQYLVHGVNSETYRFEYLVVSEDYYDQCNRCDKLVSMNLGAALLGGVVTFVLGLLAMYFPEILSRANSNSRSSN